MLKIVCVIPHYKHFGTLAAVAAGAAKHLDTLVVDDGSGEFPSGLTAELDAAGVRLVRHERNLGKGAAILTAAELLYSEGGDYMIVMDADGQHLPDDLPRFVAALNDHPDALVVGCRDFRNAANVPKSSRFGRKFSNFWCKLETGVDCSDTQSGFRAYPVRALHELEFHCRRYNFEIEALVKILWSGFELVDLPVGVVYAPPGERISHFDPWKDNVRLSLLHTCLVCRRLWPWPYRKLVKRKSDLSFLRHPAAFLKGLLRENADPVGLATSAAVGTFLAVLPLLAVHMAVILYVCIRLKLNKVMALAVQNLFMPPVSPFLCLELGYFLRHGHFWTEFTFERCLAELHLRVWEWLLGSLILAPFWAVLMWLAVYGIARAVSKRGEGAEE